MNQVQCYSTRCSYTQNGGWASNDTKNPIYIGVNSAGSYNYIGQWTMPGVPQDMGDLKRVVLHIYRNSNNSTYPREYYIGCSTSSTDDGSVLSTGVTFTLSAGEGWKECNVSELAEHITSYDSTWYLLIGNPNTKGTFSEVAGYGTAYMLYLELQYSDGSNILLASDGSLVPYQLHHAENGSLVQYDLYHAENGSLIKY